MREGKQGKEKKRVLFSNKKATARKGPGSNEEWMRRKTREKSKIERVQICFMSFFFLLLFVEKTETGREMGSLETREHEKGNEVKNG